MIYNKFVILPHTLGLTRWMGWSNTWFYTFLVNKSGYIGKLKEC